MKIVSNKKRKIKDEYIEIGIIEKISVQCDLIYAVVRSEGIYFINEAGEIVRDKTYLFGSNGIQEQELLLAEILIPTDISPCNITVNLEYYINKRVEVIFDSNGPRLVLMSRVNTLIPSRKINTEDIKVARSFSKNRMINNDVINYLKFLGYREEHIEAIIKERYSEISSLPNIIKYGDELTWDTILTKDSKNNNRTDLKNISDFVYVSGLTGKPQLNKECYLPILSIGGK